MSPNNRCECVELWRVPTNYKSRNSLSRTGSIVFVLLLVLFNLDFSDSHKEAHVSWGNNNSITAESANPDSTARKVYCYDYVHECDIECSNVNVNNLQKELESKQTRCDRAMDLLLDYCIFPGDLMRKTMLNGLYSLESLIIQESFLSEIEDDAFEHPSVMELTALTLLDTQIAKLSEKTFDGLRSIKNFTLVNKGVTFNSSGFLVPMADTLITVKLKQERQSITYDPSSWFAGADFPRLAQVDLSGNRFVDILSNTTFNSLTGVEQMNLANCFITMVEAGTFDKLLKTLRYLDLSNNQLKILNGDLLIQFSRNELGIDLYNNPWDCICENEQLLTAVKNTEFKGQEDPRCATPIKWRNRKLSEVTLQCETQPNTEKNNQ